MSNIVTTIPAIRATHLQSQQVDHAQSTAQADAPDEPQVTVSSSAAEEPILAD
ncbi:MAG: hypothetical protein O3C21_20385 [Verrucomicrobia bacterium]|nr:hypothetical protein [Verrucomicrobiota bacterium]